MNSSKHWAVAVMLGVGVLLGSMGCAARKPVTAEATLEVSPLYLNAMTLEERASSVSSPNGRRVTAAEIQAEVAQLLSDDLVRALIESEAIRSTRWFQQRAGNAAAHVELVDHVLEAVHIRDTALIRVLATMENADDALTILRAWVEVYLREVESRPEVRYRQDQAAFQRQLEALEAEITTVESQLRRHLIEHPTAQTTERMDVTQQELLFLNSKKREIEALLVAANAAHRALEAADADTYEPTPDEVEVINKSRSVMELDARLRQLQVSREGLIDRGPDESHEVIQQIDDQIVELENERQAEYDIQVRALFNARLEMAGMALSIYQEQINSFTPRLEELRARL